MATGVVSWKNSLSCSPSSPSAELWPSSPFSLLLALHLFHRLATVHMVWTWHWLMDLNLYNQSLRPGSPWTQPHHRLSYPACVVHEVVYRANSNSNFQFAKHSQLRFRGKHLSCGLEWSGLICKNDYTNWWFQCAKLAKMNVSVSALKTFFYGTEVEASTALLSWSQSFENGFSPMSVLCHSTERAYERRPVASRREQFPSLVFFVWITPSSRKKLSMGDRGAKDQLHSRNKKASNRYLTINLGIDSCRPSIIYNQTSLLNIKQDHL